MKWSVCEDGAHTQTLMPCSPTAAELRAAASTFGLREVCVLDYPDLHLDRACPREVVEGIVFHLRRVRPDVVVNVRPDGAYRTSGSDCDLPVHDPPAIVVAADATFTADGPTPRSRIPESKESTPGLKPRK
jgi:hypothetical protein